MAVAAVLLFRSENYGSVEIPTVQIEVVFVKDSVLTCEQFRKEQLLYMSCKEAECSPRTGGGAYQPGHSIHCGWGSSPDQQHHFSVCGVQVFRQIRRQASRVRWAGTEVGGNEVGNN